MVETTVRAGVLCVSRARTQWLSTGWDGGFSRADAAYNVSVPDEWSVRNLETYRTHRLDRADFRPVGPTLFTGVDLDHARGAHSGSVATIATVGLSNPAALPMEPTGDVDETRSVDDERPLGTANLIVVTERALDDGPLAELLAVAAEAKAATLLAETGFPGTTTDAIIVGCDPDGDPSAFAGSSTDVGMAARACVREAIRASLRARYPDADVPESVAVAEHGVSTDRRAEVFRV